ncbi:MAG: hypothetical protein HZB51_24410 [Chloroflexi bacterium]|nr:hypothetical protein [Chloroflexota bacterium]
MESTTMQDLALATMPMQVLVTESTEENAAQKENAQELAALEASLMACATVQSTTEYITDAVPCQIATAPILDDQGKEKAATNLAAHSDDPEYSTEADLCQIVVIPTLEEITTAIADAARKRIESAHCEMDETRARIERECAAREITLQAMQERVRNIQASLDRLVGERAELEKRARTFLSGGQLNAMLGQMHLAFNARQLELEDALATAKTDEAEEQEEIQTASVTDALELQLAQQELEKLESSAPEVAQAIKLAESAGQIIAAARQAVSDGMLHDAAALLHQARAANADPIVVADIEQQLASAKQDEVVRDLVARINANTDQPGALKRIREMIQEAETAGIADKVTPYAEHAMQIARNAANARFAQARPIANHLVKEGFIPVIGDGRIEAWTKLSRNGDSNAEHQSTWVLDHILSLRGNGEWRTEKPRVPVTRKTLSPRVMRSRWYHEWVAQQASSPSDSEFTDQRV